MCVARVKELPVILEFTSFQDTSMFYKRGRFGLEKVQNSEIKVKVVLDMECGNIFSANFTEFVEENVNL